jgi:lipid-A-disaccharide synthase-like uncharacterized protein
MSEKYWIYALGFFSQGLFGVRFLIQWWLSEKERKIVSPLVFWQISLVACFLFIIYGILRNDFVIIFGQSLAYIIYIRNLQLRGAWNIMPVIFRVSAILLPLSALTWLVLYRTGASSTFSFKDLHILVFIGSVGQLLLNFRFVYQLYHAEKTKTAGLPLGFWLISTLGSILILLYAVDRSDPVLLLAQSLGLISALRNIQLHYKSKNAH